MSLKAFHLIFIFVSILFCAGMAAWSFKTGASDGLGWGCGLVSVLMCVYAVRFISKAKSIIT
jgi:hypothetical protein